MQSARPPGAHAGHPGSPRVPNAHLFRAGGRHLLFSVPRGEILELDEGLAWAVDQAMLHGDAERVAGFLAMRGIAGDPPPAPPPESVPVRALSLAVAQKCNLGCTYCYAEQGGFGGPARSMSLDTATAAIDRLLEDAAPGGSVALAYLGGEPLANREVLRASTEHAAGRAAGKGVAVAFSLTTNATLLTDEDAEFLERHAFSVTVSVDGIGETHDRQRPFKSGRGSYERVMDRSRLLLSRLPRRSRVVARVSVTPANLRLPETLEELVRLGFDGVTFSPVLSSPTGAAEMDPGALDTMLGQLIECGHAFERQLAEGRIHPFTNVVSTLRRIHHRTRDAYPCGAGGGYLGVGASGGLYACHRFVDDDAGAMGSVRHGIDDTKRRRWLTVRNVHAQAPCQDCWARYLCSGGCHHEAIHRGRPACDYIRGWLHYCLGLYATLMETRPPLLDQVLGARTDA